MKVNIMAKGFELKSGTHEGIENELSDLNKIIGDDLSYRVTIKKRVYGEYECMISTYYKSRTYNIKATRKSIKAAIEASARDLKGMILENNAKVISKKLNAANDTKHTNKVDHKSSVTKHKEVQLTPISDAEAIANLDESGHDMFMYLDEATLEVKGVYHRADGYGVITFKSV